MKACIFDITVGSHWPERENEWQNILPVGGAFQTVTVEIEPKGDGSGNMKEAEEKLEEAMNGKTYHIWYWTWSK